MATLPDFMAAETKLEGMLADLRKHADAGPPTGTAKAFRARQRREKSTIRKFTAHVPAPGDALRRQRLEADVYEWLHWYLPGVFTSPFQEHHCEMIEAILRAVTYAGDQGIAAPRGEGKSSLAEGVTLYIILKGLLSFVVIFSATAPDAKNSLGSVKEYIGDSDQLAADYPALCVPVREVQSTPNKAHSMRVYRDDFGQAEARFVWNGPEISFPSIAGLTCAGARFTTRGLDSAVRGLKKGSRRPQLAIIDDPDTAATAASDDQADKLAERIERAIAGLAPQGKRMSRVLLTTLQNRRCVSARFTDPTVKPSWNGKRFSLITKPPTRVDLWEEYIGLREARTKEDPFARKAHTFYLKRRKVMDAGAVVANPFSFDNRVLPDGSRLQVSTLQRYYDFVADNGLDSALCELQNDPPEASGPLESGITAYRIQRQVSGYPREQVPPAIQALVQGIDVGKYALHFVVKAFRADATAFVIDYGIQEVHNMSAESPDAAIDRAILAALYSRREAMLSTPYTTVDGEIVEVKKTLVDARYRKAAVYHFCQDAGLGYEPAMGHGRSRGCAERNFRPPVRVSPNRIPGDEWYKSLQPAGVWLVIMNTDHWKSWEHDRWMTPPKMPGSCLLFGDPGENERLSPDQKGHFSVSKHLTNEIEIEEDGVRRWKVKSKTIHYYDASYMADVAGSMSGISLLKKPAATAGALKTMSQLAAEARAARDKRR